jgi:hypothetical protein
VLIEIDSALETKGCGSLDVLLLQACLLF